MEKPEIIFHCLLCERPTNKLTDHHVVPRSRGGTETIAICVDCHRQIHVLYDNKMLEEDYNTAELLLASEGFSKYLMWAKNRPVGSAHKAKRSRDTKRRGRRG